MPTPTPPKSAAARSKPARGAKAVTRRTIHDTLDAAPAARKAEPRSLPDGPKKSAMARKQSSKAIMDGFRKATPKAPRQNDTERKKTVNRMMDGFSPMPEDTARETVAKLQHNMQVLHRSVIEAKRDVEAQMKKIAAKRKAFAPVQARMLAKTYGVAAKAQAKITQGLTEARNVAADAGQSDAKRSDKAMRGGTGKVQSAPAKSAAAKTAAPARKASAATGKSAANGARRPAAAKPAMAAKAPAAAAKAKPAAKPKPATKPAKSAKPATAKMGARKSAPAKK